MKWRFWKETKVKSKVVRSEYDEDFRNIQLGILKMRAILYMAREFDSDPPELKKVWPL